MNEATKQLIAGITVSLKGGEAANNDSPGKDGYAEFSVGATKVKIDPRGISITFHEGDCDPVELRIDRPKAEAKTFGDIIMGGSGGSAVSGSARSSAPGMAHAVGAGGAGFASHCVTVSIPGIQLPRSERVTIKAVAQTDQSD
jgi:hypothetical protein